MALCLKVGAVNRILLSVVITVSGDGEVLVWTGEEEFEEYAKGERKGERRSKSVIMLYCFDHMTMLTRPTYVHSSY